VDSSDHADIVRLMREARERDRGYASFFGWSPNRDLEELGPVQELAAALAAEGNPWLTKIQIRGRGSDPPDLEAVNQSGQRVAIEVTELVDGEAIRAYKNGDHYAYAEWSKNKFLDEMQARISAKISRQSRLLGGPYPGGYVVVVFTDEPMLSAETVRTYLSGHRFAGLDGDRHAYLVLSYSPAVEGYPYFALREEA